MLACSELGDLHVSINECKLSYFGAGPSPPIYNSESCDGLLIGYYLLSLTSVWLLRG